MNMEKKRNYDFELSPGNNVCEVVFIGEQGLEKVFKKRLVNENEHKRNG